MELKQLFDATVAPKEGEANIEQIYEEREKQVATIDNLLEVDSFKLRDDEEREGTVTLRSTDSKVNFPQKKLEENVERENNDVNQAEESKHMIDDCVKDDADDKDEFIQ